MFVLVTVFGNAIKLSTENTEVKVSKKVTIDQYGFSLT